jgi:2-aminoadipate transaminase
MQADTAQTGLVNQFHFAKRSQLLRASEIREILKITEREEVISFAGGLPAPELFPIEEMKQVSVRVLEEAGRKVLQYSTTEGYEPLRQQISERMNRKFRTNIESNNVLITSGSQQALDLLGKLFIDEGDIILCESPTYLAAISAFRAYQPRFIEVPTDTSGMIIDELANILKTTPNVKFIYVIPDFQNPTGKTWSIERRKQFMQLIQEYEIPVIEDNPYGDLRFENETPPALQSMDEKGLVICLGTFSKTFCPGMRIGWIAADSRVIEKCVLLKQGADLCTSLKTQMEISYFIEHYDFEANVQKIISIYRSRRDAMLDALAEMMPAGVSYTRPQGGLFLWVELPEQMKAIDLLKECLLNDVAFVPGDSFFPNGGVTNTLRLNYSNMSEPRIREGVKRIANAIRKSLNM